MTENETPKETNIIKTPIVANAHGLVLRNLEDMFRFGQYVVRCGLAQTPEQALIKIQTGAELGITPMKSLQTVMVVNNQARLWGDMPLALVRKSGLMEYIIETIEGVKDGRVAICKSKRKDSPNAVETRFSVTDAIQAGLWNKAGTWKQYPERMLKYRARSFNLRDNFPDALAGVIIAEEYEGVEAPQEQATPQVPGRDERKQAEDVKIVDTQQSIKLELDKFITKLLKKIETDYAVQFYPDQKKDREKIMEILGEYALCILHPDLIDRKGLSPVLDYTNWENYTLPGIATLHIALNDELPEHVINLLPKPLEIKTPEEQLKDAEATAKDILEDHKYKCSFKDCGHLFDRAKKRADGKIQCPKCLRLKAVKLDEVEVE